MEDKSVADVDWLSANGISEEITGIFEGMILSSALDRHVTAESVQFFADIILWPQA